MDRPRRVTRPPTKYADTLEQVSPNASGRKRKTQDTRSTDQLHFLLTNPKSSLTTMDISELINTYSWNLLSPESQGRLKALLPPTAFIRYTPTISSDHPSAAGSMIIDEPTSSSSAVVDTSVFTDPHFLAAAHTFQDHLYSDWLSKAHADKLQAYLSGIQEGATSAAWKDEVWERENTGSSLMTKRTAAALAGEAAEVKLVTLAKNGVIRVGDIIALKRNFSALDLLVEKDAIIESIHPKTHALKVLLPSGTNKYLPTELLSPEPPEPSPPTQIAIITSPSQLETTLLDQDGRVEKSRRPNGNAWKCMTVWRWRGDAVGDNDDDRWGRENHGTLFYLRSTYYHEQ